MTQSQTLYPPLGEPVSYQQYHPPLLNPYPSLPDPPKPPIDKAKVCQWLCPALCCLGVFFFLIWLVDELYDD